MKWLTGLLMLIALHSQAAIQAYEFKDAQARETFQELTLELRCPKCQNQSIADSNAPIANDLRAKVHVMVNEGHSKEEIIDYMVARYGDFVLYKPKVDTATLLLWYGPFVFLGIGILVVVALGLQKRKRKAAEETHLSQNESQQLEQLLKQDKDQ